ncbi:MAG: hypothetical protein DCC75_08980 [Proteobacteria bacterium]|nr:MAG: hypothetical protein DCC75_08980 [Pseudomonadota bacterium]
MLKRILLARHSVVVVGVVRLLSIIGALFFASFFPPEAQSDGRLNLPEPRTDSFNPLVLESINLDDGKSLLPAELLPAIRTGTLKIPAAKNLRYAWRYDEEWLKNTKEYKEDPRINFLDLPYKSLQQRGFAFGAADIIKAEKDAGRQGSKILWNVISTLASQRLMKQSFAFVHIKENRTTVLGSLELKRAYLAAFPSDAGSAQIFREIIRFIQPDTLSAYAWLAFRFFGEAEDAFWLYSPAISKSRQLTGSNRSDPLYRLLVSPDDLLVWSGKPEILEAKLVEIGELLIPFESLDHADLLQSSGEASCVDIVRRTAQINTGEGGSTLPNWLFGSFPSDTIFVPRTAFRLELGQRDPYSLYGRQTLYVDAESMLPAYKFVYSRTGQLIKIIIGGFGLAIDPETKSSAPFNSFLLAMDAAGKERTQMSSSMIHYCSEITQDFNATDFDPSHLAPVAASSSSSSQS